MARGRTSNKFTISRCWLLLPLAGIVASGASGCLQADEPPPTAVTSSATLVEAEPQRRTLVLDELRQIPREAARAVVRGPWGDGPAAFGRRTEASAPGPMALEVSADGAVWILDQVNRRAVQHGPDGARLATVPIPAETAEDLRLSGEALWLLSYARSPRAHFAVQRLTRGGEVTFEAALDPALDLLTGLFVVGEPGAEAVWVERRHEEVVQVVRAGRALPLDGAPRLLGRGNRGQPGVRLWASKAGPREAALQRVFPGRYTSPLLRLRTPRDLVAIQALESDRQGRVYLGLLLADEGPAPEFAWTHQQRWLVRHGGAGAPLAVELFPRRVTDAFRPLTIGPRGTVYQLTSDAEGVTVWRWDLPGDGGDA